LRLLTVFRKRGQRRTLFANRVATRRQGGATPAKETIAEAANADATGKSLTLCAASWIGNAPLAERPMRAGCVKGFVVLLPSACL